MYFQEKHGLTKDITSAKSDRFIVKILFTQSTFNKDHSKMNNFLEKRDVRESKMSVQMGIIQSVREMFQVVYP